MYLGASETSFKLGFGNHKNFFNVEQYKKDTKLTEEYWRIKELNETPSIKWKIFGKYLPYNQNTKKWNLYLDEMYKIVIFRGDNLLNKRSKIIGTCRHRTKYKLINCDKNE